MVEEEEDRDDDGSDGDWARGHGGPGRRRDEVRDPDALLGVPRGSEAGQGGQYTADKAAALGVLWSRPSAACRGPQWDVGTVHLLDPQRPL